MALRIRVLPFLEQSFFMCEVLHCVVDDHLQSVTNFGQLRPMGVSICGSAGNSVGIEAAC
jgi:hypothetical protein